MKRATFRSPGEPRVGMIQVPKGRVFDLPAADASFADMFALIDAGQASLERTRDLFAACRGSLAGDPGCWGQDEFVTPSERFRAEPC